MTKHLRFQMFEYFRLLINKLAGYIFIDVFVHLSIYQEHNKNTCS